MDWEHVATLQDAFNSTYDETFGENWEIAQPIEPEGEGWELVSAIISHRGVIFYWKRKVQ